MEVLPMETSKALLKNYLSEQMRTRRQLLLLTQEAMVESLQITPRAYGDLERGKYCVSASVLLLFLCQMEDAEILSLVCDARQKVFALVKEGSLGG